MSAPKDKEIEPINATMDAVVEKPVNPPTNKAINNKGLIPYKSRSPLTSAQGELNLKIQKQIEIDGIGMGVLSDGTAIFSLYA